jgi:hypothetical protein
MLGVNDDGLALGTSDGSVDGIKLGTPDGDFLKLPLPLEDLVFFDDFLADLPSFIECKVLTFL